VNIVNFRLDASVLFATASFSSELLLRSLAVFRAPIFSYELLLYCWWFETAN